MLIFTLLVGLVVYVFARSLGFGIGAIGFSLIIVGLINFFSYYFSDRMVLAMVRAKPIVRKDNPELYRTVENLTAGASLPLPRIYLVNDPTPNAFATGRDPKHAAIAVHTGLLERLEKRELEGVLAHELSHIKNYDTRLAAIVAILAGTLAILADWFLRIQFWGGSNRENRQAGAIFMALAIVAAILAPIAAMLIQFAISRKREFLADASGILLTRYPEGLAQALGKIASSTRPSPTAHTATAHLYISNPFGSQKVGSWLLKLFNTHPPVEERIKILRSM